MLLKLKSPFKFEEGSEDGWKNMQQPTYATSSGKGSSVVVGLRILTQNSQGKSNVVVKSALKISLPASRKHQQGHSGGRSPDDHQYCFLKSCHSCNKNLSLDKEVYMYRGDQGFCSIECRDKQIVLDEMREFEQSAKQRPASYRRCNASGRRETRILLEDLRRRNKSPHQNQKHWATVS